MPEGPDIPSVGGGTASGTAIQTRFRCPALLLFSSRASKYPENRLTPSQSPGFPVRRGPGKKRTRAGFEVGILVGCTSVWETFHPGSVPLSLCFEAKSIVIISMLRKQTCTLQVQTSRCSSGQGKWTRAGIKVGTLLGLKGRQETFHSGSVPLWSCFWVSCMYFPVEHSNIPGNRNADTCTFHFEAPAVLPGKRRKWARAGELHEQYMTDLPPSISPFVSVLPRYASARWRFLTLFC